ncbi:MAG: hypothetical protein ACLT98_12545 [Eggerthellaceae bacterium]
MFWWPMSFIGLAGLAPVFAALCARGSVVLALIKPQLSAHDETDRGIVRDEAVRRRVVEEVKEAFAARGFRIEGSSKVRSRRRGQCGVRRESDLRRRRLAFSSMARFFVTMMRCRIWRCMRLK